MKKVLLLTFVFSFSIAYGQNEFAANAFYNEFKKLHNDAQAGFVNYKGSKLNNTVFPGLIDEYAIQHLLPLADSGKLVFPITGYPYAEFYFQPGKTLDEANQRAVNLRQAILTAYGNPLYIRTETSRIKEFTFSNTLFFTDPNETNPIFSVFKSSVFREGNKYYITFRVIGRIPPVPSKSALTGEIDLDGKLKSFFNELPNCFGSLKSTRTHESSGFANYESKITLFGIKGQIEESNAVCRLKFSFSFNKLSGIEEAGRIYDQLKASLLRANNGKLTFNAEKQDDHDKESYTIFGVDHNLEYKSMSKNLVKLTIVRNAELAEVYLDFYRNKF